MFALLVAISIGQIPPLPPGLENPGVVFARWRELQKESMRFCRLSDIEMRRSLEKQLNVRIVNGSSLEMFGMEEILRGNRVAPPQPDDVRPALIELFEITRRYPEGFIKRHIDRIVLSDRMLLEAPVGGFYSKRSVVISTQYNAACVREIFAHELMHAVLELTPFPFGQWQGNNPQRYLYRAQLGVGYANFLEINPFLGSDGNADFFVSTYSEFAPAEDVCEFARYAWSKRKQLGFFRSYNRPIAEKYLVWLRYMGKVDARITEASIVGSDLEMLERVWYEHVHRWLTASSARW